MKPITTGNDGSGNKESEQDGTAYIIYSTTH